MLVGSGRRNGDPADLAPCSATPSDAARDADTLRAARATAFPRYQRVAPRSRRTRCSPRVPIRYRRGAELDARGRAHVAARRAARPARPASSAAVARAGRRSPGRSRAASSSARSRSADGKRRSRRVPLVAAADVPAAGLGAAHQGLVHEPAGSLLLVLSSSLAGTVAARPAAPARAPAAGAARAESRRPHDHHRHAQHGDRQDARGAELPARPPPPHGRADDDAGRQGRQRRARAQDARPAGDRHRARRRRDRHAHRRAAHAALGAVATSCASARSRAPTPR